MAWKPPRCWASIRGRVFKTLMVEVDGSFGGAVVPVSGTLDLKALAAALGAQEGRHG